MRCSFIPFHLALLLCLPALATAAPGQKDQQAFSLYKKVSDTSLATHSYTADFFETATLRGKTIYYAGSIKLMKPLYLRQDVWSAGPDGKPKDALETTPHKILASDGTTYWQIASDGTTVKEPARVDNVGSDEAISNPDNQDLSPIGMMFFNKASDSASDMPPHMRYAGTKEFDGATCRILADDEPVQGMSRDLHLVLLIGPDNLLRQADLSIGSLDKVILEIRNIHTGVALAKSDFAFTPPSWSKPAKTPAAAPTKP